MTSTDDFYTFIQQSINVEGLPFLVAQNSNEALREQAVAKFMMDLKGAEERADREGWIDAEDLERELGELKKIKYTPDATDKLRVINRAILYNVTVKKQKKL